MGSLFIIAMSQSQFDVVFAEGAAKIFKEYLEDQIKVEAVESEAVLAEAKELGVLPMVVPNVVDLTTEDPADQSVAQIEQSALRKIHVAVRLLSEVLQPQVFKSDWRVKFEKKTAAKSAINRKMNFGGVDAAKHDRQQHNNAAKAQYRPKAKVDSKDWKVGGFVKRQKNAAMTDHAM